MQRERWLQVKEIVNACLAVEEGRREQVAEDACQADPTLLREVTSMLASYGGLGDFLAAPVVKREPETTLIGSRVGLYEIREPIAAGGMGTVYRAVRTTDFEKQVAVKVVKRGMDSNFILQRFRHERQILAGLEHPNIARLLDGGATGDGRPYLVMEYVEGLPITEHAEREGLKVSERLQLFRTVCSAVQYAHQNLVVHRDLKAGNILVTPEGTPKLLDFGIAKLLEPDADVTVTSLRLMTPECASPEQVRGEAITTATDVYSLGVLLYELLTGARPYRFEARTAAEVQRLVCETAPKKPSTIRQLSEDLDNIVLKAMHKEPARRYASAEQLSEDVRRFLAGLPVSARSDSAWYRARKFVGRHKTASVAAGVLFAALCTGMAATLWEAHVARVESARAERRFNDVRDLADSLMFEVHDAIQALPGSTAARKLLVDRAVAYLDRLALESGPDESLRRELARGYLRLGEVQSQAGRSSLGDTAGAVRSFQKAITFFARLDAEAPLTAVDQRTLARAYDDLSNAQWASGDRNGSKECDRKALTLRESLADHLPALELTKELSLSYQNAGLHRAMEGDFLGALEYHEKFLSAREQISQAEPNSPANQRNLSLAHKRVGAVLIKLGRLYEALAHYRLAETIDESRAAANPESAEVRMDLTFAYSDIGFIRREQRQWRAALAQYRKAEVVRSELAAADPKDERAHSSLANTFDNIGGVLWKLGEWNQAVSYQQRALALLDGLLASNPGNTERQAGVALLAVELGDAHARLATRPNTPHGRQAIWQQARGYYQRALQLLAAIKTRTPLYADAVEADKRASRQLLLCDEAIERLTASDALAARIVH